MGVIVKQSIKNTIYSYLGAGIGFVNTAIFINDFLKTEEYGITQYLLSVVLISSSLLGLGFVNVTNRLFPYFRNKEKDHNGFLTIGFVVCALGAILACLLYVFYGASYFSNNDDVLINQFGYLVLPVIIFNLFYNFLDSFFRMTYNSSIGVFLREIVSRLATSVSILLYAFKYIDFEQFMWLFFIAYTLPLPILLFKLILDGDFKLTKPRPYLVKHLRKAFVSIALFGFVSGLGSIAVLQIDRLMIGKMIDVGATGIYSMGFYFATLIMFPIRSVKRISITVLSEAWKNKQMNIIASIYKKSSITLLILGLYIFIGLWANIDNIMAILNEKYAGARNVIFFIGISNLVLMVSGVNSEIISTSKKYIYNSVFIILTLVMIVLTNYIFIPIWGIVGAAIASLISTLAFAIMRYLLVLNSFKMQPFSKKHLIILGVGFLTYGLVYITPSVVSPWIDIAIKGSLISILFFGMIYLSKASEDINLKLEEVLGLVVRYFRK